MKPILLILLLLCALLAAGAFVPVGGDDAIHQGPSTEAPTLDLSGFSDEAPGEALRMLFIHHSVGGTLLAEEGPVAGASCIFESHPNGGGLRAALAAAGYEVHEASYGSRVGSATDLFDWLPKFRDDMEAVLATDRQDAVYPDERRNRIVMFKSCFPNSDFVAEGEAPGDPEGPELTYWNARASLTELRQHLAARPDVLFVYLTAPPLVRQQAQPAWRWLAKPLLGRQQSVAAHRRRAALARRFNDWVVSPEGWLAGYPQRNLVAFDYFGVLTGDRTCDFSRYPTGGGADSHPSAEGNRRAAAELLPLLNRAVRRGGLIDG